MKEYDLYVPLFFNDGTPVSDDIIESVNQLVLAKLSLHLQVR